ncbi:AMP-binding protein [Rhodobacterales bacterium LSUCC1028]|nr:AMP-binding protein [Rhodobacterales bacterium LSUCC1028]
MEQTLNALDREAIIEIGADANLENVLHFVYACYFCVNVEMVETLETPHFAGNLKSKVLAASKYTGEETFTTGSYDAKHILARKNQTVIIETSGTSGVRKKIVHSIKSLEYQAKAVSKQLEMTPDDRQLAYMPMNYIYGLSIIYTWLYSGSTLVISEHGPHSMSKFFQEIIRSKITVFSGVPFTYLLMKKWGINKIRNSNIRCLTQAGGYLPANVKKLILEELPEIPFIVMYGQTEFCGRISQGELKIGFEDSYVGKLLDEIDAIVDENGELYVSSPSICLNADQFMCQKIHKGQAYYSTGDIAQLNEAVLSVSGRNQNFIKVGGRRIPQDSIISLIEKDSRINSVFVTSGINKTEKVLIGISIDSHNEYEVCDQDMPVLDNEIKSELKAIIGNVGYEIILLSGSLPTLKNGKFDLMQITSAIKESYIAKKTIHFWL